MVGVRFWGQNSRPGIRLEGRVGYRQVSGRLLGSSFEVASGIGMEIEVGFRDRGGGWVLK